ncbi:MAG TPA: inositol monophosphatase family protein [Alphaproteobacteria bacterium]|nr:inositol monophosphatase family protein [Alphaproteobacteria bacterium]
MASEDYSLDLIRFAERLADAAGKVARRHFRNPALTIEAKPDLSPVTQADREVEQALRREVAASHPDHGFVGEEFAPVKPEADYVWVVDPIDGTKAFLAGKPTFGTLIALLRHGRPLIGLIDHPVLGERWIGAAGHPTTHSGKPVHARRCSELKAAVLCASSPEMFEGKDRDRFERLRARVCVNGWGTDCLAYGLLASGFVDLVAEAAMGPHDYLPLVPVVEGAGGRITDWDGRPLSLESPSNGRVLAAGDPELHGKALRCLALS